MRERFILTALSVALMVAMPAFTQAVEGTTSSATSSPTAMPTQAAIAKAAAEGQLDALLSAWLGDNPTQEQLAALSSLMEGLTASKPALAAQVALSLAEIASDLAGDHPQMAVSIAAIVSETVTNPNVISASPSVVATAVVELAGTITLAERSADAKGITLADLGQVQSVLDTLAVNSQITQANPDIQGAIKESVDLANAEANLAGFSPAAGPGAGVGGATTGAGAGASAGFESFSSSGGGGGTPADTEEDASTTTL